MAGKEPIEVVLLVETSRQLGRSILKGVIHWSQMFGPAKLKVAAGHLNQVLPPIDSPGRTGVIARISDPGILKMIEERGIPIVVLEPNTVELTDLQHKLALGVIRINPEATGEMGADHLFSRGFQQFAFCGFANRIWSDLRQEAFVAAIESHNLKCECYPLPSGDMLLDEERPLLRKWIESLPRPIGLMACDDDRARQVLEVCESLELRVPQEIAVLGAADDELLCELSSPPLSSIAFDLEKAGFEAMKQLAGFIDGTLTQPYDIVVNPLWVTTRLSTDYIVQNDRLVTQALRFIRRNYFRPIAVIDVVKHVDVSRRTLENRFLAATGRTIMDDIIHQRFERAKQLLISTDEPVAVISILSGFVNYRSMLHAFNMSEHCTPNEFRQKWR